MNLDFAFDIMLGFLRRKYKYFIAVDLTSSLPAGRQAGPLSIRSERERDDATDRRRYKVLLKICVCVLMPWFLSGCLATKYLKEEEKLLYSQTIKAPKGFSKEGLSDLYVKKANSKFLGLPINTLVWMYYKGLKRFDIEELKTKRRQIEIKFDAKISKASSSTKKTNIAYRKQKKLDNVDKKIANGNNFMQWGEPVAVFDTASVLATENKLTTYLQLHGYFKGATTSKTIEFKRRVGVVYTLTPGAAYHYDTILFSIPDSLVMTLIKDAQSTSFLKNGDRYSQDNLTKERDRLDLTLKDKGYFDFSKQYIDFEVDTTYKTNRKIALRILVQNPEKRNYHKQFVIDSVAMTTDTGMKTYGTIKRQTEIFHNITFRYFTYKYSKRILSQRIFISKDSLFSRTKTFTTQRQLANLDNFKFVNINYDTTGGRFIANIFASPLDLYSLSNEVGVTVTQGFPGPYINLSLKKRNLFKGLEIGEINGRFGFEGVASATDENAIYASTEASINGSLVFPQFLFPFSQKKFYQYGQYNPRTRVSTGYTYSDRPEYKRGITNISGTYTWDINQRKQFALTAVNLNIIDSNVTPAFEQQLEDLQAQGNNLINAFKKSFVSSMIFAFTWNPNSYGNRERNSHIIRATLESGGTFLNFWTPDILVERKLELYQYVRVSLDFRKNIILDKSRSLAYRINSGVGLPYGSNTVLPYEKNFFAGGSNSVRAWRPRRLGIGSTPPPFSGNIAGNGYFDYKYEKPGEILFEGSLELRQKLFGFVSSAIFVDVGNVWLFQQLAPPPPAPTQPEWTGTTKFGLNSFLSQIGVGTGFGLRFDFSFLLLRLDVGIKAWDPARQEGDRFVLDNLRFYKPYSKDREPVIYNIGIGYPF